MILSTVLLMRSLKSTSSMSRMVSSMRRSGCSLLLHPSNTSVVTTTVDTALRSVTYKADWSTHTHARVSPHAHSPVVHLPKLPECMPGLSIASYVHTRNTAV